MKHFNLMDRVVISYFTEEGTAFYSRRSTSSEIPDRTRWSLKAGCSDRTFAVPSPKPIFLSHKHTESAKTPTQRSTLLSACRSQHLENMKINSLSFFSLQMRSKTPNLRGLITWGFYNSLERSLFLSWLWVWISLASLLFLCMTFFLTCLARI